MLAIKVRELLKDIARVTNLELPDLDTSPSKSNFVPAPTYLTENPTKGLKSSAAL